MKAIGMYIFGGSQTIGHILEGWDVDKILEMTEDMKETNSYHFVKNYPNIPILLPSEWENIELCEYDLLFANPPCSGLSAINRNASVNNDANKHIYEVINMINKIQPKSFLIENAPTLTQLGLPILKDIAKIIGDKYRLTIINDLAGNHNVPMHRKRTLIVGWNRNVFKSMPIINDCKLPRFSVKDAFNGLTENTPNMELDIHAKNKSLMPFYDLVPTKCSVLISLANNLESIQDKLSDSDRDGILKFKNRMQSKDSIWDKSAWRLDEDGLAPSMTSLSQYIHPKENRDLYIREYARLMGYPDDFIFYQNDCKISTIQCLAQGVPVNFIRYISKQIKDQFINPTYDDFDCDVMYINQCTAKKKVVRYTLSEFDECIKIDEKVEKSLWF